ncbi:MAG: hypothetical protein EPO36_11700 [Chloroflexota bacterium]|nr:MAG: hypothetical protein EPO36_11700 [Chloroflexota bacterium]
MTTTNRDFDRIARAWLDLMPDEAPDRVIDAVLQATEVTPQLRSPLARAPWRFSMNRLLLAGTAATAVVIAGLVLLNVRPTPSIGSTPTPMVTPSPTATPLVSGWGPGIGYATPAPDFLRSATWLADVPPIEALGQTAPRARLSSNSGGNRINVFVNDNDQTAMLGSQPVTGMQEELWLVATNARGCDPGDLGRYQLAISGGGLSMTLTPVSEDCSARATMLGRTWTRAIDAASQGGRGVVAPFDPLFVITLPEDTYTSNTRNFSTAVESSDHALMAAKNPTGWTTPCSETGGTKKQVGTTADAFAAYLATLPGFTVESEELQIDGHRALHLTIPTVPTADCQRGGPNDRRVIEWGTSVLEDTGFWFIRQGDPDTIYLVEVDSDLYLLQWLGTGVTPAEELEVLSTVQFLDALPAP